MKKTSGEIEKEYKFQKVEWPVLRTGWVLMGVFLLVGGIGLLGTGPMSWETIQHNDSQVKYEKYLRYSLQSEIMIEVNHLPDSAIYINADYAQKVKIEKIIPEPALMQNVRNKLKIKFYSDETKKIVLYIQPIGVGKQPLELQINGRNRPLKQFIYY